MAGPRNPGTAHPRYTLALWLCFFKVLSLEGGSTEKPISHRIKPKMPPVSINTCSAQGPSQKPTGKLSKTRKLTDGPTRDDGRIP